MKTNRLALGVIFGNRDFFPDKLVPEARADITKLFGELGIEAVMLDPNETKLGGVETHNDARMCADLFRRERDHIAGVLVCLPNFGDEKGVADTLKLAGLNVPVLVQGYPDELDKLDVIRRRDAFCGKISVCNNLRQAGIPFSLTTRHVVHPLDASFRSDLQDFLAVCRVVQGLRKVRLGAVGARPGAFNTVRYSRENSGASRHQRHHGRPLGDPRHRGEDRGEGRAPDGEGRRDQGLRQRHRRAARQARADGAARRRAGRLRRREPSRRHRDPMLDVPPGQSRVQHLHVR